MTINVVVWQWNKADRLKQKVPSPNNVSVFLSLCISFLSPSIVCVFDPVLRLHKSIVSFLSFFSLFLFLPVFHVIVWVSMSLCAGKLCLSVCLPLNVCVCLCVCVRVRDILKLVNILNLRAFRRLTDFSPLFHYVLCLFQLEIIRSRSVERLSFSLTVATFFTSTSWTLYGLQLGDYYIMVKETHLHNSI